MSSKSQDHQQCTITPRGPELIQAVLVRRTGNGLLSYRLPKPAHPRTPAPDAVRRITSAVVFRSNDPSLTSFLRFPPEIRVEIYRLLLRRPQHQPINYRICTVTMRFVLTKTSWLKQDHPWARHGLFPAILECSRLVNQEGSKVLYGENQFLLGCSNKGAVNSWPLGKGCLEHISQLDAFYSPLSDTPVAEQLVLFQRLSSFAMETKMSRKQWEAFLQQAGPLLVGISKMRFRIWLTADHMRDIIRLKRHRPEEGVWGNLAVELECKKAYLLPLQSNERLVKGRRVGWKCLPTGDYCSHTWQMCFQLELQ